MKETPKKGSAREQQLARSAAFAAVMALRHSGSGGDEVPPAGVGFADPVRRVRRPNAGTWTQRSR